MTETLGIHRAALMFSREARESVANGGPFNQRHGSYRVRASDRRDILAALLVFDGLADVPTAGPGFAARIFGLDPSARPMHRKVRALYDLSDRCDAGEYADPGALRLALAGRGGAA